MSGLLESHLCLLTSGFVVLDCGPSLVSALEMGNLSPCHVFHPVVIYSCLEEERKVFCLSNHLLCKLLLLNLFSLVTVVQVCAPLSIMHWVNWVHSPSFCPQYSPLSKGNSTKILKIIFFFLATRDSENTETFQAIQEHKHELPSVLKMKEKSHKL